MLLLLTIDFVLLVGCAGLILFLMPSIRNMRAGFYNNRGNAHTETGDWEQAIQEQALADYNKALKLDPNYADAYYQRGLLYGAFGDHEQAALNFKRYLELVPDAPNRKKVINNIKEQKSKLGQ